MHKTFGLDRVDLFEDFQLFCLVFSFDFLRSLGEGVVKEVLQNGGGLKLVPLYLVILA